MHRLDFVIELIDKVIRRINVALNLRPTSYPFISGDTFRSFAEHVFDGSRLHSREGRQPTGGLFFCPTHCLKEFVRDILPSIREPYVLITHNSDAQITEDSFGLLASNLLTHWFAQNAVIRSPKLTVIPIGLENAWLRINGKPRDYVAARRGGVDRKAPRILYGFNLSTNVIERQKALNALRQSPLADHVNLLPNDYRRTLRGYMFVASPAGNGIDCHRTWEALYMGVIPIVTGAGFYSQFPKFPGLVLEEWDEILKYSQADLADIFDEKIQSLQTAGLIWADYWRAKINEAVRCSFIAGSGL